ncbi:MAG: hypothetical protein FWC43_12920 [Planctomycetaceae bacterium]|nr:hypothetical protein [Planctomycetaceae bacterium]
MKNEKSTSFDPATTLRSVPGGHKLFLKYNTAGIMSSVAKTVKGKILQDFWQEDCKVPGNTGFQPARRLRNEVSALHR